MKKLALKPEMMIITLPKEGFMKIGKLKVSVFKIRNRKGYAAICAGHLTEGRSRQEACDRMVKAVNRTRKKHR